MKKIIVVLTLLFAFGVTFVGCSNTEDHVTYTAVGVQNTKNAISVSMDGALEAALSEALDTAGSVVAVYEIDGRCYRIQGDMKAEYDLGLSKTNKESKKATYLRQLETVLNNATPKTGEVDLMDAFTSLANAVNSMAYGNTSAKKQIILVTNLLSTSGSINFAQNSLYVDLDAYAEFLSSEMPDMTDIAVHILISDTADGQDSLNNSDIENLKSFYRTLIEGVGGTVDFATQEASSTQTDRSGWPNVSTVDVRNATFTGKIDITLDESVLFQPNSTEWADKTAAISALQEVVEPINNSDSIVLIVGSTATTSSSEEKHVSFSKERAAKVKELLISLGANDNKMLAFGIGKAATPYRVADTGNFAMEVNRAKNRCVFIVSANCEKGQCFLKIGKSFTVNGF